MLVTHAQRTLLCPLLHVELYTHLLRFSKDVTSWRINCVPLAEVEAPVLRLQGPLFMLLSQVITHEIAIVRLYLSPSQSEFLTMTLSALHL